MNRPRRLQPALPYRPISPRKLAMNARRRLRALGFRGAAAHEMIELLVELAPNVRSGVIFKGDLAMGKAMGRHAKTAHRSKYRLEAANIIRLHCAGPKMCPCPGCGGQSAGGKILNANGQPVSAATGYEFDPSLLKQPRNGPHPAQPASYQSTAAPARRQADRFRGLKDLLSGRPGP